MRFGIFDAFPFMLEILEAFLIFLQLLLPFRQFVED